MRSSAAESLENLFEPEVVLPDQFYGRDRANLAGGERKLMAALLADGVEAYITQALVTDRQHHPKHREAADWIFEEDASYIFSFDSVCQCLGIDADYLRLGLARYVKTLAQRNSTGMTAWKKIRRPRK